MMPTMAGAFFAGAVYRYSKGGQFEQLLYGGFASLMCSGMLRALEGFVQNAGPTSRGRLLDGGDESRELDRERDLTGICAHATRGDGMHMGGVVSEIYPGSTWIRKFIAAMGALMVSGMVRFAESMVTHAHGI